MQLMDLERPPDHGHLVQFFGGDEHRLVRNVAVYLGALLRDGGGALIIAARARREAIVTEIADRLGAVPPPDRLVLLDPRATLDLFMVDERPDAALFDAIVGSVARELHARFGAVRAYGEMVGVLWTQGNSKAAAALEELWNDLRRSVDFGLYCGYPIDVLGDEFQIGSARGILDAHTHVASALSPAFGFAMKQAMGETLGERRDGLRPAAAAGFPSLKTSIPAAEGTILHLRNTLPRYVDGVIERARTLLGDDRQDGRDMRSETG
jgi:MEDS: MEthanogen/methylotroph, DcmR Sensory domain